MKLSNVKLIIGREIRDQLRDRRTMFMIFVLPVLLYPLLGLSLAQISQFVQEQVVTVMVVGAEQLKDLPPLLEDNRFSGELFDRPEEARQLRVMVFAEQSVIAQQAEITPQSAEQTFQRLLEEAQAAVAGGQCDAALLFPPDFAQRLASFRNWATQRKSNDGGTGPIDLPRRTADGKPGSAGAAAGANAAEAGGTFAAPGATGTGHGADRDALPEGSLQTARAEATPSPDPPAPQLLTGASERSLIAERRLLDILRRWSELIGRRNLEALGVDPAVIRPIAVRTIDLADKQQVRKAVTWGKILPMLLVLWAMTGAFYPAVDLCAGEKERGTLETLLSSPAQRSEIVVGKLVTIILFSMVTAVLNLVSMAITGLTVLHQMPGMGPPPATAALWLAAALLPVSALFSALCLALAAFARSTKEGQYYLMPLMMVSLPLVILPFSPAFELNLGNSLIPVAGLILLLRSAIEGNYWQSLQYLAPVTVVTLLCCFLAIRWAIEQFNSETVLFRESEQFSIRLWLGHLIHTRRALPTAGMAVFFAVVVLVARFFLAAILPSPTTSTALAVTTTAVLAGVILAPAVAMALLLTSDPAGTLLLKRIRPLPILAAGAMAVVLHPLSMAAVSAIRWLYPSSGQMSAQSEQFAQLMIGTPLWLALLAFVLAPAVCEELAFRGFVLSGFWLPGKHWKAIIYSALLFGVTHAVIQQSLNAVLLGLLIGYIAVKTGSVWPGMAFHAVHNSLKLTTVWLPEEVIERWPHLALLLSRDTQPNYVFYWPAVLLSGSLVLVLLCYFVSLPHRKSAETPCQPQQDVDYPTPIPAPSGHL